MDKGVHHFTILYAPHPSKNTTGLIKTSVKGGHKVGEKIPRVFQAFPALLYHRLSQQKVNVIMTFIKVHSTSTPAI